MNSVLSEILQTGVVQDRDGRSLSIQASALTAEAGHLLYDLVRQLRPARTLEVGLAYGISTLSICQALHDNGGGSHTAIDPGQTEEYQGIGLLNTERADLRHLVRFFEEPSQRALPRLAAEGETFDLIFIDGCHLFDYVMVDAFFSDQLIGEGGHLAFDDLWMPGVRKAVSFMLRNRSYSLVRSASRTPARRRILRMGRRILQNPVSPDWTLKLVPENVAILKKGGADRRRWDFHRPF